MSDMPKIGPTGEYPDGKIDDSDEGAIEIAIAADPEKGLVAVAFGSPVAWLALPPENARQFGESLIKRANELEKQDEPST